MNWLEQLALLIVLGVVGVAAYVTNWALKLKKSAELKANIEAQKRMEVELKHEINNKNIHDLVDESNKRHGRG
jgi:cell division protein FtsB